MTDEWDGDEDSSWLHRMLIAGQRAKASTNTPTPEPQVIVEPWMRDASREILLAEAVTPGGISTGEGGRMIARAYAPERARLAEKDKQEAEADAQIQEMLKKYMADIARLQAQLEAADRLSDLIQEAEAIGWDNPMCHETITGAVRVYLGLRGRKI